MNQIKDFFDYLLNAIKLWIIVQNWEQALIVRMGKRIRKVSGGIFFRLPYFDSVYVQETRLRVLPMAMQTLTTKDLHCITLNSCCGYSIIDIEKLYNTLYYPETTIANIAMGEVADYVYERNLSEITPKDIENNVLSKLQQTDFGLSINYYKLSNFAIIKAYRLIQDQSWTTEGIMMNEKK